jgi:hypothetical protein
MWFKIFVVLFEVRRKYFLIFSVFVLVCVNVKIICHLLVASLIYLHPQRMGQNTPPKRRRTSIPKYAGIAFSIIFFYPSVHAQVFCKCEIYRSLRSFGLPFQRILEPYHVTWT